MAKYLCYITRIEKFSASHRLHSYLLDTDENVSLYGKCNNLNGHGHNYTLEVTVFGPIDSKTGMVINITDLKIIIQKQVLDCLDHKNLDLDVEYFKSSNIVTTTENLAVYIWKQLSGAIGGRLLQEIKLWETDKNVVVYRGEQSD